MLPHGLAKLCSAKLICKVCYQINPLNHSFLLPVNIGVIGEQHKDIITAYCTEQITQNLIES